MGVNGLTEFLRKKAPGSKLFVDMESPAPTKGEVVFVDALLSIYQASTVKGAANVDNMHIRVTFNRCIKLVKMGYYPIWVFDGAPHDLKRETLDARVSKEGMSQKIGEVRTLLEAIGIQFVDAPGEAEAQCVEFVRGGKGNIIMSTDTDIIMFGGKKLRHWSGVEWDVEKIRAGLEISQDQLRDFCILLGTDYNPRVLSPAKAFAAIRTGKSIEVIIEELQLKADIRDRVLRAAAEIKNPNVIPADMLKIVSPKPRPELLKKLNMQEETLDYFMRRFEAAL